jgi:RHS repeat-associated protein
VADTNRLGWKGLMYEGDSTRLYYARHRWYDPAVGRFVSQDPLGIAGGLNLYVFAGNDPINGRDPSGACPYGDPNDPSEANTGDQIIGHDGVTFVCGCDGSHWEEGENVDCGGGDDWFSGFGGFGGFESGPDFTGGVLVGTFVGGGGHHGGPPPTTSPPKPPPKPELTLCGEARLHAVKSLVGDFSLLIGLREATETIRGADALGSLVLKNFGQEVAHAVQLNRATIIAAGAALDYVVGPARTPNESILYSVPISGSLARLIDEYQTCSSN